MRNVFMATWTFFLGGPPYFFLNTDHKMLEENVLSYFSSHYFRWVIISIPLWLIACLSILKDEVVIVAGLVFYWNIHFQLLLLFLLQFFILSPSLPINAVRHRKEVKTFDYLVIIRCLAFLNVFFGHWFFCYFIPTSYPPKDETSKVMDSLVFGSPWGGVWMFFTLSGYLITKGFTSGKYPFSREGVLAYYRNRIIRIVPIYYASIFIWAIISHDQKLSPLSTFMDNWLADLCFDDINPGGHVIGALWSVSMEVQFYIFAPFFALTLMGVITNHLRGIAFCLALIFALIVIKFEMYNSVMFNLKAYMLLLPNLDCFLCGATVACLVRLWKQKQQPVLSGFRYGVGLLFLLQLVISYWGIILNSPNRGYFYSIVPGVTTLVIGTIIFLWEVAPQSARLAQTRFGRATSFMAILTYCLYVVHEPIMAVARNLYPRPVSVIEGLCILPLGLLATFMIAAAFYYGIERPFDRWRF